MKENKQKTKRCWIAMFSQTGSELHTICSELGVWPDVVITNAEEVDTSKWGNTNLIWLSFKDIITSKTYKSLFNAFSPCEDPVVTLHGWLKIVPGDVCEQHQIFNGHPGDIVKFPQLKGKDPQQKAYDLKMPVSGCVIHRVTSEIDGGPIVSYDKVPIAHCKNADEVIRTLKETSIDQWKKFINTVL